MMPKFRVWDKENDRMLIPGEDSDCITLEIDENGINVYDMQHPSAEKGYDLAHLDCDLLMSTGLKDKNNNEFYDKDIVMDVDSEELGVVEYQEGQFRVNFRGVSEQLWEVDKNIQIIGNIYQHPELLEGE